ncbi:MAG: ATP-binding cassette domain-containing protein [Candidatus Omnitrophota bacterium]
MAILKLKNIHKHYKLQKTIFSKSKFIKAVHNVSFEIEQGETLGLVGESGCGKSTLAKIILKLIDATEGDIFLENINITRLKNEAFRPLRKQLQIVFQDPYSSLSPGLKIKDIISEGLIAFKFEKSQIVNRVNELIHQVGLTPEHLNRLPHQLSGGERQRVGIARAIAINPKLIVLDEAVSSLDLSIQAQILNLLVDLQKKYNLTYLFIAHNLHVVRFISDRIAVMYQGEIVETGKTEGIWRNPQHPYTKRLLSSMPSMEKKKAKDEGRKK